MRSHDGYDPESTLTQMRLARTENPLCRESAPAIDRAVAIAKELWPCPVDREIAGFGALVAAATIAAVTIDGATAMTVNMIGLFGQGLVDDARAEVVPDVAG